MYFVERNAEGITWEADLRHVELIRKSFGVTGPELETSFCELGSDRCGEVS